jgi:hypothetical protein
LRVGKGYSLRVLLSRERFANGLRVYGIDQDEQQEYAGRFCRYLGGTAVPIRTVLEAEEFSFADVGNPDVLIWDLHDSDERDRGFIFAALKAHLVACCGRPCSRMTDIGFLTVLVYDRALDPVDPHAGGSLYGLPIWVEQAKGTDETRLRVELKLAASKRHRRLGLDGTPSGRCHAWT